MLSRSNKAQWLKNLTWMSVTLSLLSGCGGSAYRGPNQPGGNREPVIDPDWQFPGGGSGGGGTPGNAQLESPDHTATFSDIAGEGGISPTGYSETINTDNRLLVRVVAGGAGNNRLPDGQYTNFSGTYGCVRYQLHISTTGRTVTTKMLTTTPGRGLCPNAPTSQVIDLSNELPSGHGPVTVSVVRARTDTKCQQLLGGFMRGTSCDYNFSGCYSTYCSESLYPVYKYHTYSGELEFDINGYDGE